jgi:hypothetical protein
LNEAFNHCAFITLPIFGYIAWIIKSESEIQDIRTLLGISKIKAFSRIIVRMILIGIILRIFQV